MSTSREAEPRPDEADIMLAKIVLGELLEEIGSDWNSTGIKLKLQEKIDSLDE